MVIKIQIIKKFINIHLNGWINKIPQNVTKTDMIILKGKKETYKLWYDMK